MRKNLTIAAAAALLAVVAGCSKTDMTPGDTYASAIGFSPINGKLSTKAMIDGTEYKSSDPTFGTLAYYLAADSEDEKTWSDNMAEASLFIPVSEVSYKESVNTWSTAVPYYWPTTGGLTFFAYSPYYYQEEGNTDTPIAVETLDGNSGIVFHDYDVDAHQNTDFMVADLAVDQTANGTNGGYKGVPIVFKHKLSQIVGINFLTVGKDAESNLVEKDYANTHTEGSYVAGDVVFKLKKVTVNNLLYKGNYGYFSTKDEFWNLTDARKAYTWFDDSTATAFSGNTKFNLTYKTQDKSRNDYLLILPQPLNKIGATTADTAHYPAISIEYQVLTYNGTKFTTENVSKTISLYDMHEQASEIAMGKKITYTFKINLEDRQIYWAPSVADWDDQSYESVI